MARINAIDIAVVLWKVEAVEELARREPPLLTDLLFALLGSLSLPSPSVAEVPVRSSGSASLLGRISLALHCRFRCCYYPTVAVLAGALA